MKKILYLLILLPALSFAQLGEYYYSNNDSNEKGLDFQIKIPLGFEEKEPSRPGIVKMWEIPFGKPGGYVSIGIVIVERPETDNASKDALINAFKNKDFLKEYISVANKQLKSFSDYKYYVIDNNPGFIFEGTQDWEGGDSTLELHIQSANVYTESHIFQLSLTASRQELLNDNKSLFSRMANSIVFPEQWKQLGYIELPSDNLKLDEMNPQLTADIITNKFSGFKEKSFWGNDNLSVTIEPYSVDIDQITSSYLSNLIYDEERYNLVEFFQIDANETFGVEEQGKLLVGFYKKNNYFITKLPVLVDYGYSSYVFDIIIKVLNTDKDIIDTKYVDSDSEYVEKTAKMLSMIIPLLKDYIKIPQILTEQQMSELTKNYLDNYIKEKGLEFTLTTPTPKLQIPRPPKYEHKLAEEKIEDYNGTILDYNKTIELQSDNAIIYTKRGSSKRKSGDLYGALADYNKAIELKPDFGEAYNDRAIVKFDLEDYKGSIEDLSKAIELKPGYGLPYFGRGNSKRELGDYYGAIEDYNKAIELESGFTSAYSNRGRAKYNLEDYKGAIADYSKAIELQPDDGQAYYNRATVKSDLEDLYGAIADYSKAIELKPDFVEAYINRGIEKEIIGDLKGACEDWKKAANLGYSDAAKWVKNQCN
tara:strand:+ start:64 stop:2010 length:1947 start_codon:yes stop_codon:yes gene_type:complete